MPRRPLAALALLLLAFPAAAAASEQGKIDPWIFERLGRTPGARVGVLVELAARADLSTVSGTKAQKGRAVFERLTATAANAQGPLLDRLAALGVRHRAFWIADVVWVDADAALVDELAKRDDVLRVVGDTPVRVPEVDLPDDDAPLGACPPGAIEWGVAQINADDVWALGATGQGIVVAGQDTGYQWTHPALQSKYRGWNGAVADHNYNWHDSIHAGGGVCGANASAPCDDNSHGTHTMGTMVGLDGANQIGVAPGAKWIGCRNMDQGNGTPSTYIECFQWFLAPTDSSGQNPDPSKSPDVMNNSWSCPTSEGCNSGNWATMQAVVESLRAAGIMVVVSAGNGGSGCGSVSTPAAMFDASFSIGNTTSSDTLAGTSSRGPVTVDGSNRMKPDLSAPGSSVCSSVPTNSYATFSGTSMAGPHVVGAVALLLSAQPKLAGNVDLIEELLERTASPAVTVSPAQTCGGIPSTQIPNNSFGWGRVDVLAAVQAVLLLDDFETEDTGEWDAVCPPTCGAP